MPMSENGSLGYASDSSRTLLGLLPIPSPVPDVSPYPPNPPSYHGRHSKISNGSFAASSDSGPCKSMTYQNQSQSQSQQVVYWTYPTFPVERSYLQNLDIFGPSTGPYSAFAVPNYRLEKPAWPGDVSLIKPSEQYPELHPLLAADGNPLSYDVRWRPRDSILANMYELFRGYAATAEPVQRLRIVSAEFPWAINVAVDEDGHEDRRREGGRPGKGGRGAYVRVGDVWKALHKALQKLVDEDEWAMAGQVAARGNKDEPHARMERALERRQRSGDRDYVFRRVDWLGRRTKFTGLVKEEQIVKEVSIPDRRKKEEEDVDVWVAKFAS